MVTNHNSINEAMDISALYQEYMALVDKDPVAAAKKYIERLTSKKPNTRERDTAIQLKRILAGDRDAWMKGVTGAKNARDAIRFCISNSILNLGGFTADPDKGRRNRMEDIIASVASMISESTDMPRLTQKQKRLKQLAEQYGYIVYPITESEVQPSIKRKNNWPIEVELEAEEVVDPTTNQMYFVKFTLGIEVTPGEEMVRYNPDGSGHPGSPPEANWEIVSINEVLDENNEPVSLTPEQKTKIAEVVNSGLDEDQVIDLANDNYDGDDQDYDDRDYDDYDDYM